MKAWMFCTAGALALALGVGVFLAPHHLAAGGPPGVAIIVQHRWGVSPGLTLLLLNGALLALGARGLGVGYALRTAWCIALSAATLSALSHFVPPSGLAAAPLLNAVYGGALVGLGLGLALRGQAGAGAWSVLAHWLARRLRWDMARTLLLLDAGVIASGMVLLGQFEAGLWAGLAVWVSARVFDWLAAGCVGRRGVWLVARDPAALACQLRQLLEGRLFVHAQTLTADGGWLWLEMDAAELPRLGELLARLDPNARALALAPGAALVRAS